ncbi:hypothetical protein [Clostridium sp. OS1-26]|uniref:hypothetical protein n=1 Tax=Clostridium sp. OS1-26 TaxID=3070681 RepID=UPI0027E04005|nr:hypothetical protein [Clostridium sp. OS1-26]WML34343.1 hypothetical protein RCG18_24125 [Clostridium sp. OS1-26]
MYGLNYPKIVEMLPNEFPESIMKKIRILKKINMNLLDTIELVKEIDDERNQYFIIAGVLTSTDKFIDEEYANVVRSSVYRKVPQGRKVTIDNK